MVPIAEILSLDTAAEFDQKQTAIARALEMEAHREKNMQYSRVLPLMDIEEVWTIEDTREETDEQLVWGMSGPTGEMGYDAQSQTFYCTLGLDTGDDWPEIQLNARGQTREERLQVVWIDDYTYDPCSQAIAEGYRYEMLAYTDTQYAYIGVVFTGLPIVTLMTKDEITRESNVPGRMTVAAAGYDPVDSAIVAHLRGGGYEKPIDKPSYRVEMHMLGLNGRPARRDTGLLGMKPDSEWLLLSNAQDESAVRNGILYSMWEDWNKDQPALMLMDNRFVEVFEGNEYMGIYQLMERVKPEEEIAFVGGDVRTDCVVRGIAPTNKSDKPVLNLTDEGFWMRLEYRYEANGDAHRAFDLARDYYTLCQEDKNKQLSDEEFAELALERVDIENMMNYILFYHACTLRDNSANNIYLYIMRDEDGRYLYHHAPWDMDTGLWVNTDSDSHNELHSPNLNVVLPTRMLELDVGGCREILWNLWNEKRSTILSREEFSARIENTETMINASGAYLRESEKWYGEAIPLNLSEMMYYAEQCLILVRMTIEDTWPVEGMELVE